MATEIRMPCHNCSGVGQITPPEPGLPSSCPICGGTGKLFAFIDVAALNSVLDDVSSKINDILDKCNDIKAKCDEIFEEVQG